MTSWPAIAGLTQDPVLADALRLRRLYVRPSFRRFGIGRTLVDALLGRTQGAGRTIVVNAARGSSAFWEALGFVPDKRDGHTHAMGVGMTN